MKYFVTGKISENIRETPEGFLVCVGVPIARTGEMEYGPNETPLDGDEYGHVIIERDEDEVFRPETIASFQGKPITIAHPDEFVSPENWKELAKGVLQNVRRGEGEHKNDLIADLLVTDQMAIGLVKNGLREVSCGYEADYEQIEKGKGKQKNIIGNNLALVDQGRAGHGYAINDHKGDSKMALKDKVNAIFAKAKDEALKVLDEKEEPKKEEKSEDSDSYDELVKVVKDLAEKVDKMGQPKDQAEGEVTKKQPADDDEEEATDKEENETEGEILKRVQVLEAAVEKLLAKMGDEEESEDDDEEGEEKSEDDDMEDDEMDDDDFEESTMVGDSKEVLSRAEILAPGIKKSKDIVRKALKTAYGTEEGKKVIDSLAGKKALVFDTKDKIEAKRLGMTFIAASELLKASRKEEVSKTKKATNDYSPVLRDYDKEPMTPEKLNEINAKHFAKRA